MAECAAASVIDRLRSTVGQVEVHGSLSGVMFSDVEHDSRRVTPTALFCAVPGTSFDGHDFVPAAAESGAVAALVERQLDMAIPQIVVDAVRPAMAHAAAAVHGDPSHTIDVFGVTGTNGKTTTTQMLASVFEHVGADVEVIGTLAGRFTTPESTAFQRVLRDAAETGKTLVAAEVSSHALDQHRVDGTRFAVAAFSNLTPDHLDFHGDMETYFEAKTKLFDGRAGHELINVDDPWGRRLAATRPDAQQLSLDSIAIEDADLTGTVFVWNGQRVSLPIAGRMNVANALMAAEAAVAMGLAPADVAAGLSELPQVRGRMEVVSNPDDRVVVVVDYSHTPDSIERALSTLRDVHDAPVSIVFGCGGDRDRTKRPLMGAAAEAGADLVVVTSDNPRSEPPMDIIDAALEGMSEPGAAIVDPDRRNAIRLAIEQTPARGVVLIAGKGHEATQTIGTVKHPFDDAQVSREVLRELAQ